MPRFVSFLAPLAMLVALLPALAQNQLESGIQPLSGRVVRHKAAEQATADAEALKAAGLSASDGARLIGYLKLRTVSDADQGKIQGLIKKLGADQFADRIKAGEELEFFGPAAIGLLKSARNDPDPEVAYQADRVLKRMEKIPHSVVAAAAVRAVVKSKPPGSAAALLGFLPLADTEAVADEIREALVALAAPNGKPEPALVRALADPSPVRRRAAYVALLEGGPANQRIRIKESFEQVKEAVRNEKDPSARFRGLWSLVLVARQKDSLSDLIQMIPELPRGRLWQLEDLLLGLAGAHPEGGRFGKTPELLAKSRDVWAAWWQKSGAKIDFDKFDYKPRILGYTDLVEFDPQGFGQSRFVSLAPDMKEKVAFASPSIVDARFKPDGKVAVVENYYQVNDRDVDGTVAVTRNLSPVQPLSVQMLPDGGMLIVLRQALYLYDKDGKRTWAFTRRNAANILCGCRLPNGETIYLISTQQGNNCFRLDAKGKPVGNGIAVGRVQNSGFNIGMDSVGNDKILICEQNRVAEYDLKTGKEGWKYMIQFPTSVQRLPNGNILVSSRSLNIAREVDPSGEVVWEYRAKKGLNISKAYRR